MDEPDKVLQAEIEARRAALEEESEWRLNEWKRDFEAQVKAGLIDRGKLESYFKTRDIRRRPRRDEPVNEEVLRVAREDMLRDRNALMSAPPDCVDPVASEWPAARTDWVRAAGGNEARYDEQRSRPAAIDDGVAAGILEPAPTDDRRSWGIL